MKKQEWELFLDRMLEQGKKDKEAGMPIRQDGYTVILVQAAEKELVGQLHKFLSARREEHLFISQPAAYKQGFLLVATGGSNMVENLLAEWQLDFGEQYGAAAFSIGGSHDLMDIYQSLREARMAGFFQQVTGKSAFVQNFNRMGLFTSLFRQSSGELTMFCEQTIGPLMEYDQMFNTRLLETLRVLLDEDFNWTRTAARLYVHVNTLRYRYEKIRQILDMDESLAVRADLFAAVRASEVLAAMKRTKVSVLRPKQERKEVFFHADKKTAVSF
ncbi:PucR family transcriptional regulator [Selenomonas ruminantium]|uniref:PucR C-terminal helix-turn-helix domain-containing protein n=1 Tax=Selenomonas ruminantium TaxID=971 RepID=A0A1H0QTU4_SELRU|nr:helix-turn-helix domain-containing protein [Selenomonas ruminantium]SDP20722.1 PucR C-terminal helix-turn-helix domain-containing protein [Selenomonas ruminantium]